MGIKGLMKLIADNAPRAIREQNIKSYFGRKVAIDASMSLYQFLIAVRSGPDQQNLTNEFGEVTSHLQGMFYRTIRMMDNGIKPVYVFDGKAPEMKSGELAKRKEARDKAEANLKEAKEADKQEDVNKYQMRTVRVTSTHNDEVKKLLRLMGVPVIEAAGEAEATCAELCKKDLVYATATEDMDALTFGTPKLVRHLTFSEARKMPVAEIDLKEVLEGLDLTMEEFIDMCILCGCDYTDSLRGVGPVTALKYIRKYKSIEKSIPEFPEKIKVPDTFLYKEAHKLFVSPRVTDVSKVKLEWKEPDIEGVVQFLCKEKGFNEDRIRSSLKKLVKARSKGTQQRLESFFGAVTVKRKTPATTKGQKKGAKAKKAKTKATAKKTKK